MVMTIKERIKRLKQTSDSTIILLITSKFLGGVGIGMIAAAYMAQSQLLYWGIGILVLAFLLSIPALKGIYWNK